MEPNPRVQERTNIADVLREHGGAGGVMPDLSSTMKRVESVNTVKFVFHPWMPIQNLGPDGFNFNVHYDVLQRLKLIPIPVFDYAKIIPLSNNFSLMSAVVGEIGAIPGRNQNRIETLMQMPTTSVMALRTAYGKFGLVELTSLESYDTDTLNYSFDLFDLLFHEATSDMERKLGYRPPGLVLEDYPHWLDHVAPRLVQVLHSEKQLLEPDRAMQLLSEIRQSVSLAEEAALSPSVGILPKTKEGLNITANRGTGGKTHLDALDEWLLKQYPSFEMDTDVERARAAMQNAIESSGQGNQEVLSTMVQMIKQQQTTLDLLTQFVTKKPTKASASPE